MTTLVTGATGFVGSQVVDQLLARGKPVRALVRDPGKAEGLRARGVEVVGGDVRDPSTLDPAVRGAGVVHHCAAAVGPHFSKREIYDTNLGGVRNVLEAMRRAGAGRMVLLSSVNVLGTRDLDPATEETPCRPSSDPAADVKIEAEQLALTYRRQHGVDVTILRPGFIYGPGDPHNVPKLIRAIERGKFAFIGSRDNVVPIVHVRDVAAAMLLAAGTPAASGQVYNLTDGSRTTAGEFVDHLAELLGRPRPQRVLPYALPYLACLVFGALNRLGLTRRQGPVTRAALRFLGTSRYVDIRKARQELGYEPRVRLREGLAETIRQLRKEQPHGTSNAAVAAARGAEGAGGGDGPKALGRAETF